MGRPPIISPKTAWKWRNYGPEGWGRAPGAPFEFSQWLTSNTTWPNIPTQWPFMSHSLAVWSVEAVMRNTPASCTAICTPMMAESCACHVSHFVGSLLLIYNKAEKVSLFSFTAYFRGQEPGWAPRAEGEHMSAEEHKQHNCDQKVNGCIFKPLCTHKNGLNWSTLKFHWSFLRSLQSFVLFFWNINLKYEMHMAKLQNGNKF